GRLTDRLPDLRIVELQFAVFRTLGCLCCCSLSKTAGRQSTACAGKECPAIEVVRSMLSHRVVPIVSSRTFCPSRELIRHDPAPPGAQAFRELVHRSVQHSESTCRLRSARPRKNRLHPQ